MDPPEAHVSYVLHGLLERSAATYPDHPAVVDGARALSYKELDRRANQLANLLIQLGVKRGDRVGLYLDKSMEAVVGIYGILKAGAAYVSIDIRAPVSRARYIVGNCGIQVLITAVDRSETWGELSAGSGLTHVVVMDGGSESPLPVEVVACDRLEAMPAGKPDVRPIDRDLAYIIYTSGSTGAPKGVKLTHLNALAFVNWTVEEFGVGHHDRLSSHAPFHFDLSIFDLYAAAHAGATVFLVPPKASVFPIQVARFIHDNQITVWYSVPSILSMMVERGKLEQGSFPALRTLLFAGEVFPSKYLATLMRLLPHVEFYNLYGPTETNVCTFYHVAEPPDPAKGDIPIGHPIPNTDGYVVREDGTLAAPGEVGELWIRSSTVMGGYWGDPEKTRSRLLPDPFATEVVDMVYRTGDLVAEDELGEYRFLGRRDNQIKSRGYRIELGEIETALYQHPAVAEAAVVAVADDLITNSIHAYLALKVEAETSSLLAHCKQAVPPYMVPESFEVLADLPKTSTGKIDRQRLKAMAEEKKNDHP
jgi:amino acid adenylation domain-containing protein